MSESADVVEPQPIGVAIVGAGLQARRRAEAMGRATSTARLVAVSSRHDEDATSLSRSHGGEVIADWSAAVVRDDVEAVLVCTPPDSHAAITVAALAAGKHVLCEKPMARTGAEATHMVSAARAAGRVLACGFNHRYHPAIRAARDLLVAGELGQPVFLRCAYGIAGRPGYEHEWRSDPEVVSGGHLVEQGIHAVDLAQWLLGDVLETTAACSSAVWPIHPLEDNAMLLARHMSGALSTVHASLTQWVNMFRLEIGGADAVACVEGLGGGYGTEALSVWPRTDREFRRAETLFRGGDRSWDLELAEFLQAIRVGATTPPPGTHPGVTALRVVEAAYQGDRNRTWQRC